MNRTSFTVLLIIAACASHATGQNCSGTSVGLKPLTELGSQLHQGSEGGLYPQGLNERPWSHDSSGRALAGQVKPLSAAGIGDALDGKIVLLSIGMSNATQEFSTFKGLADPDPTKNPQLVIVDGAQGGQTASTIADPAANFWSVIDQRLTTAGVTREQVQVAWVKEANANPTQPFPSHTLTLQGHLESIARILKSRYPNIKLAYWSSRTYAGYATTTLNPEPYAYESGFAVKWLIAKQIEGDTSLVYEGFNARAPWLAWGPYLWADGTVPRMDGLSWECSDFQSDGTHPSTSGRQKVANQLLTFFKTDPTTVPWFLKPTVLSAGETNDAETKTFVLQQNFPNPFNPGTNIHFHIARPARARVAVYDVLGKEVALLLERDLEAGFHQVFFDASLLPSGAYWYRLTAGSASATKPMILAR
ncbi:MAG: T9SS type A sorting domain-containing protein [Bacteroidota bacterium]